jgi:hypothetical protein
MVSVTPREEKAQNANSLSTRIQYGCDMWHSMSQSNLWSRE